MAACFTWTNIFVSASSWLQGQRPDRSILLLQRTFSPCVTQIKLAECKDAIRSERKENNSVLFSFKHRQLFQDFSVMSEPTTFRRIPVPRSFLVCDFKLFKYCVNPRTFACLALDIWQDDIIRISFKRNRFMWRFEIQHGNLNSTPSIKILSAWCSSVGKPHYGINKQPQINTTWSFTLKRMSLLHCPFGDIWMVAKHLQLCNGQVVLASIIFQLGLYIETIFNHFHKVKQRRWYAWLNFVCWKWSHELWFMLLQVFSYYFSFLCHVNSVTIVTC